MSVPGNVIVRGLLFLSVPGNVIARGLLFLCAGEVLLTFSYHEETLWGESGGLNHRMLVLLPSHKGGLDHGRFIGKGLACHRVGLEHGANG